MRAILTYHSVDDSGSPISIDRETLARHANWLATGPVPVLPLSEVVATDASRDAIALTFDDGFRSFAEDAWPILKEHGLPATVFVVTDHVGRTNRWGGEDVPSIPELPLLGWEELGRLAEEGVDLGAHSRTHPDLTRILPERIAEELESSLEAIERETGNRPASFAYPYGRVGPRVLEEARRVFELACTTELAIFPVSPDPHLLPRLDTFYYRDLGRLEAYGSTRFRLHLAARAAARRVREAIRPAGRSASQSEMEPLP